MSSTVMSPLQEGRSPARRAKKRSRPSTPASCGKENDHQQNNKVPLNQQKRIGKQTERLLQQRKDKFVKERALRERAMQIRARLEGNATPSPTRGPNSSSPLRSPPTSPSRSTYSPKKEKRSPQRHEEKSSAQSSSSVDGGETKKSKTAKELQYLANKEIFNILTKYEEEREKEKKRREENISKTQQKAAIRKEVQKVEEFTKEKLLSSLVSAESNDNLNHTGVEVEIEQSRKQSTEMVVWTPKEQIRHPIIRPRHSSIQAPACSLF